MKWFRESFLSLSIGCLSAVASAQEPPVGLGKSTPLPNSPVNAFAPIRKAAPGQLPPPTVVRGARAVLEDEPGDLFLPKNLTPRAPDRKLPASVQPPAPRDLRPAMPLKDGFNFFRVDKNVTIDVMPEEPPMMLPPVVERSTGAIQQVRYSDEHIIMVDAHGNPLFCEGEARGPRWYGDMGWLLWWTKGAHLPPLVTTAPVSDPIDTRGALGFGATRVLFGDTNSATGPRSGGRITIGRTLDDEGIWSLEATYFFLATKNDSFIASSADFPVLARPFFSVNTGQQSRELITTPELPVTGTVQVASSSRLWGAEVNTRALLWCGCNYNITGLVGFRYLDLHEDLSITERDRINGAIPGTTNLVPLNPGDRVTVQDVFATRNRFYGGQVGLNYEYQQDRWTFDARAKLAFGATQQFVDIDGKQTINSATGKVPTFNGGLYALPSNSGHRSQIRPGVVPEVGFKLGYNLTDNIRLYAGYDFMYWSGVLRASDQIDQAIDASKVPNSGPGPFPPARQVRPVVPLQTSGFWAQGVSLGMEFRY